MQRASLPVVLRNRDFGLLWVSQVMSQAGTRMYQIAIMWWILQAYKTNEGTIIGVFLVVAALPAIFFAKRIGHIIDKTRSKTVLVSADLAAAFMILAVAAFLYYDSLSLTGLYASSFILAMCEAFINPTLNKAVPELVEADDVEKAISFETATQSVANFSGAVLGAVLIGYIGILGVILLNAASYALSALCSVLVQYRYLAKPGDADAETPLAKPKLKAFLKSQPLIKAILVVFGLTNFFANPIAIVLPIYVKTLLNGSAQTLGALEAALWVGLIAGAFIANKIKLSTEHILFVGFTSLVIFGLFLIIPGLIVDQNTFMICLFISGTAIGINNVKFITYFQEQVPAHIKGRFFSAMQAILSFSFPIAYFSFGALLDFVPATQACLIQGTGLCLLAFILLSLRYLPQGKVATQTSYQ